MSLSIERVKALIRKGDEGIQALKRPHYTVNLKRLFYKQDSKGNTFLHYIAKRNYVSMAEFFINFERQHFPKSPRISGNGPGDLKQQVSVDFMQQNSIELNPKISYNQNTETLTGTKSQKRLFQISNFDGFLPIHQAAGFFAKHEAEHQDKSVLSVLLNADKFHQSKKKDFSTLSCKDKDYFLTPMHNALLKSNGSAVEIIVNKILENYDEEDIDDVDGFRNLKRFILDKDITGQNCLHYAASYRCGRALKVMLKALQTCDKVLQLKPINYLGLRDIDGQIPLHLAAQEGNVAEINVILKFLRKTTSFEEDTLKINDTEGNNILHLVIESGNIEAVQKILEHTSDEHGHCNLINVASKEGGTRPLLIAAKKSLALFKLLIKHGADLDRSITDWGDNALIIAAEEDKYKIVKYILGNDEETGSIRFPNVDINELNHFERSAFLCAVREGNIDTVSELLKYLPQSPPESENLEIPENERLQKKYRELNIELKDESEHTVLHQIAMYIDENKVADHQDYMQILEKLIYEIDERYTTLSFIFQVLGKAKDEKGNTALHIACERGQWPLAQLYIKKGLAKDARNEYDETPLMLAAKNDQVDLIESLCENDDNSDLVYDTDTNANTALHLAAGKGHVNCCSELLRFNATIDARNHFSETPLDIAAKNGHLDVCKYLIEHDAPIDPTDKSNKTPLMLAAENGHYKLVQYLLDAGAQPFNVTAVQDKWILGKNKKIKIRVRQGGLNCLDLAIENGHRECAKAMLLSESWDECLRNVRFDKDGNVITPMRSLLEKYPDLAGIVLNKSISVPHAERPNDVHLNFEFIEDLYRIDGWYDKRGQAVDSANNMTVKGDSSRGGLYISNPEATPVLRGPSGLTSLNSQEDAEDHDLLEVVLPMSNRSSALSGLGMYQSLNENNEMVFDISSAREILRVVVLKTHALNNA